MEQETQTPHKRRVRYKGKYPKKFEEKYKELQPEKYQDTIEHVIRKGNTPTKLLSNLFPDSTNSSSIWKITISERLM